MSLLRKILLLVIFLLTKCSLCLHAQELAFVGSDPQSQHSAVFVGSESKLTWLSPRYFDTLYLIHFNLFQCQPGELK